MSMIRDIKEFHEKFNLTYEGGPRELPVELDIFRTNFIQEELDEYIDSSNLEHKFDALIDMVYVILGTAYMHGFDFEEGWKRVHEANMTKIRQPSERSGFDVVKPDGWKAPDLGDLVVAPLPLFDE